MKASDFMKQLEQNPEYKEMQRLKEEDTKKKLSEIKEIEAPFIEFLHKNGIAEIEKTSELLEFKKIDSRLATILLEWVPKLSNKYHSQEMLVRALAKAKQPFDGKLLTALFDNKENSESFKWAIGNTIASATVENVLDWLEQKLTDSEQPKQNEMLVYAAIKYFSYEKASAILRKLFKVFPLQVADAFTYIGKKNDLIFLKSNNVEQKGVVKTRVDKAIKKLSDKLYKT